MSEKYIPVAPQPTYPADLKPVLENKNSVSWSPFKNLGENETCYYKPIEGSVSKKLSPLLPGTGMVFFCEFFLYFYYFTLRKFVTPALANYFPLESE